MQRPQCDLQLNGHRLPTVVEDQVLACLDLQGVLDALHASRGLRRSANRYLSTAHRLSFSAHAVQRCADPRPSIKGLRAWRRASSKSTSWHAPAT
jgi:hypothetical protein